MLFEEGYGLVLDPTALNGYGMFDASSILSYLGNHVGIPHKQMAFLLKRIRVVSFDSIKYFVCYIIFSFF